MDRKIVFEGVVIGLDFFSGNHGDKLHITYKTEGSGFQADDVWKYGFAYEFYLCNDTAMNKYIGQGVSALRAQVLGVFDNI